MKSARTSIVQATNKPAYKHRTRTKHFSDLFSNKASNKDIEQGFEQAASNNHSNKDLRTSSNKVRTKNFLSMKYNKPHFALMDR